MGLEKFLASILGIEEGKPETLDKGGYAYIEIDFEDANYQGNNIRFTLPGKSCTKVEYTGDKQDATLKIGDKRADELPLSKIKSLKSIGGFNELFLSSSDTHGKLILIVSAGVISEVKPTLEDEVSQSRRTMKTDVLVVDTTNEESVLTCPTGKRLEILGFNAMITQKTPTGVSSSILCYTLDEDAGYRTLFRYTPIAGAGDNAVHTLNMSGIIFRGGLNRNIALNHMIFTAGAINASVTLYYRAV